MEGGRLPISRRRRGCIDTRTGRGRWLSRVAGWSLEGAAALGAAPSMAWRPLGSAVPAESIVPCVGRERDIKTVARGNSLHSRHALQSDSEQARYAALRDKELRSSLAQSPPPPTRSNRGRSHRDWMPESAAGTSARPIMSSQVQPTNRPSSATCMSESTRNAAIN